MPFQPEWIVPTSARLYGHVFENSQTGLARNLFWNLAIECQPIRHGRETLHCSISCDWLTWPLRRWPELHGQSLTTARSPDKVQASIYLNDHVWLNVQSLTLRRVPATARFVIDIAGECDLEGYGDLDGQDIAISARCEAEFEGLVAIGANFEPPLSGASSLNAAVAPFVDLAEFHPVTDTNDSYRWAPIPTA